MLIAHI